MPDGSACAFRKSPYTHLSQESVINDQSSIINPMPQTISIPTPLQRLSRLPPTSIVSESIWHEFLLVMPGVWGYCLGSEAPGIRPAPRNPAPPRSAQMAPAPHGGACRSRTGPLYHRDAGDCGDWLRWNCVWSVIWKQGPKAGLSGNQINTSPL